MLAVLRLTRGDEEADRSVLVLVAPVAARQVLQLQMIVVSGRCAASCWPDVTTLKWWTC